MRSLASRPRRNPDVPARNLLNLRLRARPSELKRARECVTEIATGFGLADRAGYAFTYAVNEAMTNAIRHGRPAQDGTIGLRIEGEGEWLVCTVSDSGPFVPRDPSGDEFAESGRGFAFMSALVDDLQLRASPSETVVQLSKRRPGAENDDA